MELEAHRASVAPEVVEWQASLELVALVMAEAEAFLAWEAPEVADPEASLASVVLGVVELLASLESAARVVWGASPVPEAVHPEAFLVLAQ